jgi:hypothetical protein
VRLILSPKLPGYGFLSKSAGFEPQGLTAEQLQEIRQVLP